MEEDKGLLNTLEPVRSATNTAGKEAGKRAWDCDDKDLAMVGIVALALVGSFLISDPTPVIMGAIAALGALATGRKKQG